jgi:hypothetical protein
MRAVRAHRGDADATEAHGNKIDRRDRGPPASREAMRNAAEAHGRRLAEAEAKLSEEVAAGADARRAFEETLAAYEEDIECCDQQGEARLREVTRPQNRLVHLLRCCLLRGRCSCGHAALRAQCGCHREGMPKGAAMDLGRVKLSLGSSGQSAGSECLKMQTMSRQAPPESESIGRRLQASYHDGQI